MAWKLILRIFPEAYVESYSEKKSEKFNLDNRTLEVDLIKINKLIGHDIKVTDVKSILKSLDIEIKKESKSKLKLSIPLYRWDVTREADIAEEILRIYGFNSILMDVVEYSHYMFLEIEQKQLEIVKYILEKHLRCRRTVSMLYLIIFWAGVKN